MHLSPMKSSPLRVRDQQYISLGSSYSRTSSTHSTRNPLVACVTENLCKKSFSLVCCGDEFLLYKRRTHKLCYNLKKNGKLIYIGILLQRNEPDMHREDKKFSQLYKVYEFLVSVGVPVQGVIYGDFPKIWLQFECNPVISVKQKNIMYNLQTWIEAMVNQIIGI